MGFDCNEQRQRQRPRWVTLQLLQDGAEQWVIYGQASSKGQVLNPHLSIHSNNKVLRDETDSSVQQQRPLIRDLAMASPVFTFAYNSTTRSCQNGAETWQNPCRESCHTKEPSNRKQVRWTACTIDNEHLQRRSSKSGSYPTPADLDSFLSEDENASSEEEPTMPNLRRASRDSDGRTAAKGEPPRKRSNN